MATVTGIAYQPDTGAFEVISYDDTLPVNRMLHTADELVAAAAANSTAAAELLSVLHAIWLTDPSCSSAANRNISAAWLDALAVAAGW